MQLIEIAIRTALGTVFAIAAASKLRSREAFDAFVDTLPARGLLHGARLAAVGAVIAALEAASPVLLLAWPRVGLAVAIGLIGAFTAVMAMALRAGAPMTCRCFGASAQPIGIGHIVRNALLLGAAVLAAAAVWIGDDAARGPALPEVAIAMALGAIVGILTTRWDDLAFVFWEAGA